jgi:hypothetical protein
VFCFPIHSRGISNPDLVLSCSLFKTGGLSDDQQWPVLKNHHVVMIGDSLMRYQYLSLTYALENGRYPSHELYPNICRQGDYRNLPHELLQKYNLTKKDNGWPAFMVMTSHMFAGKERCDCYRGQDGIATENRFYRKVWPSGEVTLVTFFTRQNLPFHGHTFRDGPPPVLTLEQFDTIGAKSEDWRLEFDALIAKLMEKELPLGGNEPLPPPTIVLYNRGIWGSNEKPAIDELAKARATYKDSGVQFQWKTSTKGFMTANEVYDKARAKEHKNYAIEAGLHVLDAFDLAFIFVKKFEDPAMIRGGGHSTWKERYPEYQQFYSDAYHFEPFAYTIINRRWLQQLSEEF